MPFYDYKCNKCGKTFEVIHGMNEKPKVSCEFCSAKGASRVFYPTASKSSGNIESHSRSGGGCSSCSSGVCSSCNH